MNRREFVKTTGVLSAISLIETTDAIALQKGIAARSPRLYYDATTVAKFRARLTGDAALRARWQGFLRNCNRLMEEPLIPESEAEKDSTVARTRSMRTITHRPGRSPTWEFLSALPTR